jgi:predicted GNAT family N-acyltransferase
MQTIDIKFNSLEYLAALEIRKKVFVLEQHVPEELEVDQYEQSAVHFLTTNDGQKVGTGRLRIKDQYIKFERIACLKEFRGTGVGKNLMEFMLHYAQKNYPDLTPYMHSQLEAVTFYEKLGWHSVGNKFYEANILHHAMTYRKQI